jgi:hypothetical protein
MLAVVPDYWTLTFAACAFLAAGWALAHFWITRRSAQTRLLRARLTDGSLSPRPQHVAFAHSALRALAGEDPEALVIALAAPGAEDFLADVWDAVGREVSASDPSVTVTLAPTGLEAIPARVAGRPAGLVKMPEPTAATEAHFAAIVLNRELGEDPKPAPAPEFYYFLLEKSVTGDGDHLTVFARWDDGAHEDLGPGPAPDARAFLDRIHKHLITAPRGPRRADVPRPQAQDPG